jgi:hypothetical protein
MKQEATKNYQTRKIAQKLLILTKLYQKTKTTGVIKTKRDSYVS